MAYCNMSQHSDLISKPEFTRTTPYLFRSAISNVESETCNAVMVSARLVVIAAFALNERLFVAEKHGYKLPSWFYFFRSGCEHGTLPEKIWVVMFREV